MVVMEMTTQEVTRMCIPVCFDAGELSLWGSISKRGEGRPRLLADPQISLLVLFSSCLFFWAIRCRVRYLEEREDPWDLTLRDVLLFVRWINRFVWCC
ncbi:hypothetical protein TNCT_320241 [Trichonephila clavata]|uniref:Uncharacterized protein n=1 Tax=Trichonephila clavata TaxID=2740835 RepID=A0A8X6F6K0_TRICU|nr:hypothetical protein TNCT_320241 [Trichonephila clavata]